MRIRALVQRIINQMRHDKRIMALTLIVPVLVLSLVYFILKDTGFSCKIVVSSAGQTGQNRSRSRLTKKMANTVSMMGLTALAPPCSKERAPR